MSDSRNNDLFEIESEDSENEWRITKPWDPKFIRITTKHFTVRELCLQIQDGDIDLSPDFQRSFVWSKKQQVRLVESILLGIPLPAFYFNLDNEGRIQVIDGVQRLTTINAFFSGNLILDRKNLEYLVDLDHSSIESMDVATRKRFSSTQLVAHVIEPQTPEEVKYDIFNRVNTGGTRLTAQEIRHSMSKQRSRNFLQDLVSLDSFDKATQYAFWDGGRSYRNSQRMADVEMALRFCAFRSVSIHEYAEYSSLDAFLVAFTKLLDGFPSHFEADINLNELISYFDNAMVNCAEILGDAAFRWWPLDAPRRGPINRAIFESQSLALAGWSRHQLRPHIDRLQHEFRSLFDDYEYASSVRSGTGDVGKVHTRLARTRMMVEDIVIGS